ncbi:MAG: methyltransferase domain-containing protein [Ignavibacteria bacterium]|nr:methyltransferase domain-containing protein [Ignavibacteria bacterium]
MATGNQISYLILNKALISEPILIFGSKQYDFDKENIKTSLERLGFKDITGIDIIEGEGVDHIVDITDINSDFIKNHTGHFSTVICMEVLTHVRNPFKAAESLALLLKKEGTAILSECYVRKITKMPLDLWRFTYDGTKELFSQLTFDDSKAMISLTREKNEKLLQLKYPLPQLLAQKHSDESGIGFLLRRIHRKFFADGIFKISRLLPETTIYSIAKKK